MTSWIHFQVSTVAGGLFAATFYPTKILWAQAVKKYYGNGVRQRPSASHESVITIDRLGGQGDGIGMVEGRTVYVPYGVPGDRLRVRLGKPRGQGLRRQIVAVEQAGAARRERPAPISAAAAAARSSMSDDALRRVEAGPRGRGAAAAGAWAMRSLAPLVRTAAGSRRRITLAARARKGGAILGFHAHESHDIVDLRECHVMLPALAALIAPLRELLSGQLPSAAQAEVTATATATGIDLLIRTGPLPDRDKRVALAAFAQTQKLARLSWQSGKEEPEPIAQYRAPQVMFGGVAVDLPPGAFLQATAEAEQAMTELVVAAAADAKRVADLYAGCGTFTFPLAKTARVHAVEGDKDSLAALTGAARRGSLGRITSRAPRPRPQSAAAGRAEAVRLRGLRSAARRRQGAGRDAGEEPRARRRRRVLRSRQLRARCPHPYRRRLPAGVSHPHRPVRLVAPRGDCRCVPAVIAGRFTATQTNEFLPAKAGVQEKQGALQPLGPRFRGERNSGTTP